MSKYTEKILEFSMKLDKSRYRILRLLGKILGIFPVWCAECLEKKYLKEDE